MRVCHWHYYTIANINLLQISISEMPVVEVSLTLSFLFQYKSVSGSMSETITQCFVCHSISAFRFGLFSRRKCTSHTYFVFPNIACNFRAKSFSLGNLSLL